MDGGPFLRALADVVLLLHFGIVIFVIGFLVLVLAGNVRGWAWVNALWLRLTHIALIAVVVAESWWGVTCPLTRLESWLRLRGGLAADHTRGFVEHWVQRWLFYDAPGWVFTAVYTAFGLLVATAWWRFPPRRGRP